MTDLARRIAADAERLGINDGDTVLMHSSLKSMGEPELTPKDVIDGLMAAVGSGTLVLPTLSYCYCNKDNRVFDYYKTPSNVGAIPEYFRTSVSGVRRSLCPTHSCAALGRDAEYITCSQQDDTTPCGANSPFRKVMELNGKILFLGCGNNCNTSMHAVEELIVPDYLFDGGCDYTLFDSAGKEHKMYCAAHGFKGVSQCYYRVTGLMNENDVNKGKVLAAECFLVNTVPMWATAEEYYRKDNHYFIDFN